MVKEKLILLDDHRCDGVAKNKKVQEDSIYTVSAKAFDKVNSHRLLRNDLEYIGVLSSSILSAGFDFTLI